MAVPGYITDQHVFFKDVTTPAGLLFSYGPTNWVIPFEELVTQLQVDDLDLLVQANGGSLPLTSDSVAKELMLDNGASWYDTYLGVTKFVIPAMLPTYSQFYNGCCGSGGGSGGDYELPPATANTLGGVIVPAGGGINVDSTGKITIDPDAIEINPATTTTIGGVIVPANGGINVNSAGNISIKPATTTTIGGVVIPTDGGLKVDSSGKISVDTTAFPPAGEVGQVLVSRGSTLSPEWQDVDGGEY